MHMTLKVEWFYTLHYRKEQCSGFPLWLSTMEEGDLAFSLPITSLPQLGPSVFPVMLYLNFG